MQRHLNVFGRCIEASYLQKFFIFAAREAKVVIVPKLFFFKETKIRLEF